MSDKYLFEKEGSDPDIERLESLLSVYRIEAVPPSLGRANVETARKQGLLWLRFFYVGMASLAIVAIGFSIFIGFSSRRRHDMTAIPPVGEIPPKLNSDYPTETSLIAHEDEVTKHPSKKERTVEVRRRPVLTRAQNLEPRKQTAKSRPVKAKLTPEEKYAYQQVLVALWITGSKLKVVQDTINRVNEGNENSANEKR